MVLYPNQVTRVFAAAAYFFFLYSDSEGMVFHSCLCSTRTFLLINLFETLFG